MQHNVSPEEPDALRDLVQKSYGNLPQQDVQRITGQEIKALKVTAKKEGGSGVTLVRSFTGFFGGIFSCFGSLFCCRPKGRSQCDTYGHTLPKNWDGLYPKCMHCGAKITSPDMLNSATPKH